MHAEQWVCLTCGYNMIGEMPGVCPFCGASQDEFLYWEEAENAYKVTPARVNDFVVQLVSVPALGLEHAAYRIETERGAFWIDCPSVFNRDLKPVEAIFFTHSHFMGASNQYREYWQANVFLHNLDADKPLARPFPVDKRFMADFQYSGIEAYPVGGHTPGYTIYVYQDVLFICDYVYPPGINMRFNPHGSYQETIQGALRILEIIKDRPLTTVCGYNYVARFQEWLCIFEQLILKH